MKNLKKFLFILMLSILCMCRVFALSDEEKYAKLDALPFVKAQDGTYSIELNMVDPSYYIGSTCEYDINDYIEDFEPSEEFATVEEMVNYEINMCKGYFYQDAIKTYLKQAKYDTIDLFVEFDLYAEEFNKNQGTFTYFEQTEYGVDIAYPAEIRYLDSYDKKIYNNASKLLKSFGEGDILSDLGLVNMIYHYGEISDDDFFEDQVLYRFSKFKKVMEKNSEYQFVLNGGRGGCGIPTCERFIQVGVFKDNILYEVKQIIYKEEHVLFVDKNETGSLEDKIKSRLNKYFNNKVNIEITIEEDNEDLKADWFDDKINDLLGTKDTDFDGFLSHIKLDGKNVNLTIIEVDNKYLNNPKIEAFDKNTGINVKTESYDVPVDAKVSVKDKKNEDKIKDIFEKLDLNVELAFDINLKKAYDNTFINKIENGIEVYIPVADYYDVNDEIDVYYVKTDYEVGDVITGKIVEIDDNKYVKFITDHFSTYAIANNSIDNPKTFDNVIFYFIGLVLSVLVAGYISLYLLKHDRV